MQILLGLINGIAIDGSIGPDELPSLEGWCRRHDHLRAMKPFSEIISKIEAVLADGVIDDEDRADLNWLCQRFSRPNLFFNSITADIQRLQGLVAGIVADRVIAESELKLLQSWLADHHHLKGYWPYDEIDSLVQATLDRGRINENGRQALLHFCSDFLASAADLAVGPRPREKLLRRVVCAAQPEIIFPYRVFCIAGAPQRSSRDELASEITELGGRVVGDIDKEVHYLVVGARGGECWALSFYGRKIEAALALRRQGIPLQIVHEVDLWDAASRAR
jgi:hypothetical protein